MLHRPRRIGAHRHDAHDLVKLLEVGPSSSTAGLISAMDSGASIGLGSEAGQSGGGKHEHELGRHLSCLAWFSAPRAWSAEPLRVLFSEHQRAGRSSPSSAASHFQHSGPHWRTMHDELAPVLRDVRQAADLRRRAESTRACSSSGKGDKQRPTLGTNRHSVPRGDRSRGQGRNRAFGRRGPSSDWRAAPGPRRVVRSGARVCGRRSLRTLLRARSTVGFQSPSPPKEIVGIRSCRHAKHSMKTMARGSPPNWPKSTGLETTGPERTNFGSIGLGAVGSLPAIILENNEKFRPSERAENGLQREDGGERGDSNPG